MTMHSAYIVATGQFTGRQVIGATAELLALNAQPGEAWHEGECDPLSQAISYVADDFGELQPVLVDYQPPAPADNEWQTWAWDEATRRWVASPTLALLKLRAGDPARARLVALDGKAARPAGEIAQAWALSEPPPAAAVAALQAVNAAKQVLRDRLAAIAAAADAAALEALPPLDPE